MPLSFQQTVRKWDVSGTHNDYTTFIKDFYKISLPLNDYLRNDRKLDWGDPTIEALNVFNTLESKNGGLSVLALLQSRRPYIIDIVASRYIFGSCPFSIEK